MDKQKILEMYLQFLEKKIKNIEQSISSLQEGVDSAPGPMQSHSDTTRYQQSKVVLGAAERLFSLKRLKAAVSALSTEKLDCPGIGALIILQDVVFKEKEYYFVIPEQGGDSIDFNGNEVLFVSPQSPILEIIRNVREGGTFEFRGRKLTLLEIL